MLIINAISFASEKHKGQERKGSGLPYVIHPIIVMELVQKYKSDSKHITELKCAALLHDVLEDTLCTYVELERNFGPLVASLVMELTSDNELIEKLGKNEYLKQKMVKMSKYTFTLKLLDRYSNIIDAPTEKYVNDTLDMMEYLKANREDLSAKQTIIIEDIKKACNMFLEKLNIL